MEGSEMDQFVAPAADGEAPAPLPPELAVPQVKENGRFHHGDLRLSLMAQASRMISAAGDTDISLREIARALGVTHAATYRHFGSKADLLAALATRGWVRLDDVVAEAAAHADPGDDGIEVLRRVGSRIAAFGRANPGPYRTMHLTSLRDHGGLDLAAAAAAVEVRIVGLVADGQASGVIRRDMAAEEIAAGWLAALHGTTQTAIDRALDPAAGEAAAERLLELMSAGLQPPRRPAAAPVPERRARRPAEAPMTLDLFG
jgi:AcrR family transcriptional regulator